MSSNVTYPSAAAIVPVLDGSNYTQWAASMTSFLQSKGLYKYITERAAALKQHFQDHPEKLEEIMDADEMALGHIKCNILPSYLEVVVSAKTALEAWTKIQDFFAGKETFNKIHLLETLIDGKLKDSGNPIQDVQEYIKEKSEICRRLESIGLKISEDLQVAILLARLPESYDTMRRIMESQQDLSILKISTELNREAIRRARKRDYEEPTALVAAKEAPPSKRRKIANVKGQQAFCNFCNIKGHDQENCWLDPTSPKFRPKFRENLIKSAAGPGSRRATQDQE